MDNQKTIKGKWVKLIHPMLIMPYYACSICDENYREKHDFCPNCKADMREEETQ